MEEPSKYLNKKGRYKMKIGTTLMDPKSIYFTSDMDVIDYLTRSTIIPSKSKYEKLMDTIGDPTTQPEMHVNMEGIPDPELLMKYSERIYKNRKKCNRDLLLFAVGGFAAGMVLRGIKDHHDERHGSSDMHHLTAIGDDLVDYDIPTV